jgi:hypothetical protein
MKSVEQSSPTPSGGEVLLYEAPDGQVRESLCLLALILMGDWCDSGNGVDAATNENSDAGSRGGLLSCGREMKKKVQNEGTPAPT